MQLLSIITPVYNEQENLPAYRQRLMAALERLDLDVEIVLIDDHSTDQSAEIAKLWQSEDSRVRYIRLSRNCGAHHACSAGLRYCRGDAAVLLAADLQDPPENIPPLVERWREGFDVVWANRRDRHADSLFSRLTGFLFYATMRRLALEETHLVGADVVLLDRKVIDAYNCIPERNTNGMALILWMGFRQSSIESDREARQAGRSKWTLSKKIKLFIDSIVSFSYAPIRLMSLAGIIVALLGLIFAIITVDNGLRGNPVTGWASLMVAVLVLGGLQLLMLGVLGEYLWRCFDEVRGRPRYLIEEHLPSESERPEAASIDRDEST